MASEPQEPIASASLVLGLHVCFITPIFFSVGFGGTTQIVMLVRQALYGAIS